MLQQCNKNAAKHPLESIGRKRVKEPNVSLEGTSQPLKEGRTTVSSESKNCAALLISGKWQKLYQFSHNIIAKSYGGRR